MIVLSTGTKVDLQRDPAALLELTKEEFEELKQILKSDKAAA
jgi:hypothetical protein